MDALLRFAGHALCDSRADEMGDWDGGAIQDALEACGLIEKVERVVPCSEDCVCREYCDPGETTQCYPFTELGHDAVAAYRAWQDARRGHRPGCTALLAWDIPGACDCGALPSSGSQGPE